MMRVVGLAAAAFLFVVLFYSSRFWPFQWWGRDGLLGIEALPPRGNVLRGWLRGTDVAPFDLLLWAVGAILLLSFVQAVVSFFNRGA
ncbi:MAG: hypothetical protein AAGA70_19270 [Pseudomonadota bacterium]